MRRLVSKKTLDYYYLKISLEFETGLQPPDVCASELRQLIARTLKTVFGEVGAAIPVDILKYKQPSRRALLRVPQRGYVKLRNALSLCGKFGDLNCAFRVHQSKQLVNYVIGNSVSPSKIQWNDCVIDYRCQPPFIC